VAKPSIFKNYVYVLATLLGLFGLASCRLPETSHLKIIGGTPVHANDPVINHVAVLVDPDDSVVCTVAPIAKDVFVTAAHCVFDKDLSGWTIRTGRSVVANRKTDSKSTSDQGQILKVEREIMAPQEYSRGLLEVLEPSAAPNDVALVKTSEPSAGTIPVPILINSSRWSVESNLPIIVAGYGRTDASSPESSGVLQKAELRISKVTKSVMEFTAVDPEGKMGCHGDSGGPAFVTAGRNVWLVGIVSRGDRACTKGTTVFTDLTEFWPFLDEAQRALNFRLMIPNN
jgi:secreted trypsin-like serine protease